MYKKNSRYKILSYSGYVDFDGINTIDANQYIIIKTTCNELKCALNHRIYLQNGELIEASNIKIGDHIITPSGVEKIIYKEKIDENIILYDPINVKNETSSYYSNNVLSHNCNFLGSTNTVISPDVMEYLFTLYREPDLIDMEGRFRIYEKPKQGLTYVLGVDTAKGTGENDSVVQVLKVKSLTPVKFEQVAVFQNDYTDVYIFSDIINRISIYYNKAYIMVENNAEGSAVVNKLWWDLETDSLINTGSKTQNLGIRATKNTKPKAVLLMKKLIEDECLEINDKETVEQLSSFINDGVKFYGKDLKDDLVSALYWATYIIEMDVFDETVTLKTEELSEEQHDEIWGVLSDIENDDNSFSWMDDISNQINNINIIK